MTIIVPGRPRGKGRPRFWHGRAVTDPKTRAYEALIRACAISARAPLLHGPVSVELVAWMPDRRMSDLDNIAKSALDGLNKVAYLDDDQVVRIVAERRIDRAHPRLEIRVSPHVEELDS